MRLIPPRYDVLNMSPIEKRLVSNGGVRWIVICLITSIVPIIMLSKGWIIGIILLLAIWFIPYLGNIVQLGVVVYSLVRLFIVPFSVISLLFILSLIVYLIYIALPFLINFSASIQMK